jgi:hypothetical protein
MAPTLATLCLSTPKYNGISGTDHNIENVRERVVLNPAPITVVYCSALNQKQLLEKWYMKLQISYFVH